MIIKVDYDPGKMLQTMRKRGLSFKMAVMVLGDPNVRITLDDRKDYSEERWRAYGLCFGAIVCVCFTMRGDVHWVFSMHRIHEKKRSKYYGEG